MRYFIFGFPIVFLRPGGTVKLYFSVRVELSTSSQNLSKICPKSKQKLSWTEFTQNWLKYVQNLAQIRARRPCIQNLGVYIGKSAAANSLLQPFRGSYIALQSSCLN